MTNMKMNLPICYWDAQEIKLNIEQLTYIESEHNFLENAFRTQKYIWSKFAIYMGRDTELRSALKTLLKK